MLLGGGVRLLRQKEHSEVIREKTDKFDYI